MAKQIRSGINLNAPNQGKDPNQVLTLQFTRREIGSVMDYLIQTNAGVKVFLLLDERISRAESSLEAKPGDPGKTPGDGK